MKTHPLLSRKFIVSLLVIVSASVLCWFEKIDGGVYSVIIVATLTGYFSANVVQKKVVAP